MVKLIVHIGHGKTGSSSIQETLLTGREALTQQGIGYLGLMLEHGAKNPRLDWQKQSGSDTFFSSNKDPAEANSELFGALSESLMQMERDGMAKAIWSNEWLASRSNMVILALQNITQSGHEVEIQCYVRRHDKWAISAYSQWGLKHKNYDGHVRDFKSWMPIIGDQAMRFAADIRPWHEAFSEEVKVFNFDAIGDVVEHFMNHNGIDNLIPVNENVSPSAVDIAAQAVFNNRNEFSTLPSEYNKIARLLKNDAVVGFPIPTIDKLFPSPDILRELVESCKDDIAEINTHLNRNSQPELDFSTAPLSIEHPLPWVMDQYLLRLIFGLNDEVIALRAQVAALEAKYKVERK